MRMCVRTLMKMDSDSRDCFVRLHVVQRSMMLVRANFNLPDQPDMEPGTSRKFYENRRNARQQHVAADQQTRVCPRGVSCITRRAACESILYARAYSDDTLLAASRPSTGLDMLCASMPRRRQRENENVPMSVRSTEDSH